MQIDSILQWLQATALAGRIRDSLFLFPMLEATHVIGLALVFGTIVVIDLRLLGSASAERPFERVAADIFKWTWAAFLLTALTGALMFTTNAGVYYYNLYFRAKMLLLVLAGLNMLAFELTAGRKVREWNQARSAPTAGKAVAVASIALWIGIIVMGRLIGFTTSHAAKTVEPAKDVNFDDLFQTSPGPSGKK